MANRRRIWIDTDAGVDDTLAIFMALKETDVEIVGISTVSGNTSCKQVTLNVLRLLRVAGATQIPVYEGCQNPIIDRDGDGSYYHGKDGLGDVPDSDPPQPEAIQPVHAVIALADAICRSEGNITLVCLGPLTNIAMAIRLTPDLGQKLEACYIMGGNYEGRGNVTSSAEFNFWSDPEAAHVVLNNLGAPITMVCWELCLHHSLSMKWYTEEFSAIPTTKGRFLKDIEAKTMATYYKNRPLEEVEYEVADPLLMAIFISPCVVHSVKRAYCTVELFGRETRGQMLCDWCKYTKQPPNATIVTGINVDLLKQMLLDALE